MKTLPFTTLLVIGSLALTACDRKADRVVVIKRPPTPPVVVVPQNPAAPVVVEREPNKTAVIIEKEPPVVYYEAYVEGQPAPAARVEAVPPRPGPEAVWVTGRWVRERNEHAEQNGTVSGERWAWQPGHWK